MRRPRSFLHLLSVCLMINVFLFVYYLVQNDDRWKNDSRIFSTSSPLVLLWTNLFDEIYWHKKSYFHSSTEINCMNRYRCQFTRDRQRLSQSSIVAFHLYDISRNELIEHEYLNQTWVFITGESPINFYYQNPSFFPQLLNERFDLAFSYRPDSPVPIFSSIIEQKSLPDEQEKRLNLESLKRKKKTIVWFVSNCRTFSQREKYVDQLKKYIQIDIYGRCGEQCPEQTHGRCSVDLQQYYFYLSFENSRCRSYITEKFWNIINNANDRLVPIVMGANEEDYARVAPNHSYIHVDQYATPKDLANYLHHLIEQPEEYLKYLKWRENSRLIPYTEGGWMDFLCPLCQIAHQRTSHSSLLSSRLNFSSWFHPTHQCHSDDVELFHTCKQTKLNVWMSLIHRVRCP